MFQSYLCTNSSDNIANFIIGDAQPRAQRIWTMLNLHSMACPLLLHSSSWVDIPKIAMLVVDTLLQNYDDGGVFGLLYPTASQKISLDAPRACTDFRAFMVKC